MLKSIFSYSMAFLVYICPAAGAANSLSEAEALYKKGDNQGAYSQLQAAIRSEPQNGAAHYLMGNVLLNLKRREEAIREYKRASEVDPAGTAGIYSKQALYGLLRPADTPASAPAKASVSPNANSSTPSANAVKEADNSANDKEFKQRLLEINRTADEQVARLKREMQDKIDLNGSAQFANMPVGRLNTLGRGAYRTVETYNPQEENQQIKAEYTPKIEAIQKDRDRRITELTQNAKR